MNPVIDVLLKRRSVRAYEEREIEAEVRAEILKATLRAPTAGNLMLYSILDVTDQAIKDKLAVTCDNQPFIAKAPYVLLFLADYQRWMDLYAVANCEQRAAELNIAPRTPGEGDLFRPTELMFANNLPPVVAPTVSKPAAPQSPTAPGGGWRSRSAVAGPLPLPSAK